MKPHEEIKEIKDLLFTIESYDEKHIGQDLQELRHYTMFIHQRMELNLDSLIVNYLIETFYKLESTEKPETRVQLLRFGKRRIIALIESLNWVDKVKFAMDNNIISEELHKYFWKVNNIRRNFSHPKTYAKEIANYKNPVNQANALRDLYQGYRLVDDVLLHSANNINDLEFRKHRPTIDDEII